MTHGPPDKRFALLHGLRVHTGSMAPTEPAKSEEPEEEEAKPTEGAALPTAPQGTESPDGPQDLTTTAAEAVVAEKKMAEEAAKGGEGAAKQEKGPEKPSTNNTDPPVGFNFMWSPRIIIFLSWEALGQELVQKYGQEPWTVVCRTGTRWGDFVHHSRDELCPSENLVVLCWGN